MKLSPWMKIPNYEYYSIRVIEGSDYRDVANRYAFAGDIYPRIRNLECSGDSFDNLNWKIGPAGSGKEWCDEELRKLGYELE